MATVKRIAATLTLALLTACTAVSPAEATPTASPTVTTAAPKTNRFMTLNVYGAIGNKGATKPLTADVVKLVKANKPYVIGLQEVCESQAKAIGKALASSGYRMTFENMIVTPGCNDKKNGNRWGLALLTKGKYTSRKSYPLPGGENVVKAPEPREMLCVSVKPNGRVQRVCTLHLVTRDPDRAAQLAEVARISSRWTQPAIGGDWNQAVPSIQRLFPSTAIADPGPTADTGSRLDAWTNSTSAKAYPIGTSDHHIVIATVLAKLPVKG